MSYIGKLVSGAAFALSLLPLAGTQEMPKEISLKPNEEAYCRAPIKDPKGNEFSAVIKAYVSGERSVTFLILQEHATYKAKTLEDIIKYGTPRGVLTVNNRIIDSTADTLSFDGAARFGGTEVPKDMRITPSDMEFANAVMDCIAKRKGSGL
ncbi:MAG TPA: hypothetical protein VJH04_04125 [archaeon]|nr:hypothetical protein [archaeon]